MLIKQSDIKQHCAIEICARCVGVLIGRAKVHLTKLLHANAMLLGIMDFERSCEILLKCLPRQWKH